MLTSLSARAVEPSESCAALDPLQLRLAEQGQHEEPFAALYGRSFYRTPQQILDFRLELDLHQLARLDCRHEPLPYVPRWRTVMRVSSWQAPFQPMDQSGSNIESIRDALPDTDFAHATVGEVRQAMQQIGIPADPAAATFVLNYLGSSDREAVLARARRRLSMAQMVAAAQYFGYLAQQRYDYNKSPSVHRKAVPTSDVTAAAAAELMGDHPELNAGNCSDIANAQGELLQKLGAKDVVVATSAHTIGLHSTVMARDPNGQTYYEISYGIASRSSGREGADLFHVPPSDTTYIDVGPGIYLNRPTGRTIGYVPTNAGKVYAEVAGMDIHEIEPLARATSSLIGTQLQLPHAESLQTFVARDPTGSLYGGVALTQSWAQNTNFPGAAGLVTAWRRITPDLSVTDFYLQAEQRAISPDLRLGSVLRGRMDATLIVIGSYALPFSDVADSALGADAALFMNFGTQVTAASERKGLAGRLRVSTQLLPGVANIGGATPTLFVNHVMISADGRARLGVTRVGELDLVAGSAVLIDSFGPRLTASVGVESPAFAVRLEALGRADPADPTYKEGSLGRGRAVVSVPILKWMRVSTLAEVQEGGTDARWMVSGAAELRY